MSKALLNQAESPALAPCSSEESRWRSSLSSGFIREPATSCLVPIRSRAMAWRSRRGHGESIWAELHGAAALALPCPASR